MAHFKTTYEFVAVAPNGEKYLIGFGKGSWVSGFRLISAKMGVLVQIGAYIDGGQSYTAVQGWEFVYSGRTKVEALNAPLPRIEGYKA